MKDAYIIILNEFEGDTCTYSTYMGPGKNYAYFECACSPSKLPKYFTKDQATKFAKTYEAYSKKNSSKIVKCHVMQVERAIREYCKRALAKVDSKMGLVSDSEFASLVRKYPAKEIKEIPIYI